MCRLSISDPGKYGWVLYLHSYWQSFCSKNTISMLHYCTAVASNKNITIAIAVGVIYQDIEYISFGL